MSMRHLLPRVARFHAFSLIELLVVISIIALLISITLPAFSGVKKLANSVACASNLRQAGLGMSMCHEQFGYFSAAYIPPPLGWNGLPPVIDPPLYERLPEVGIPETSGIYKCPGDPGPLHEEVGMSYFAGCNASGSTLASLRSDVEMAWDCADVNGPITRGGDAVPLPAYHVERNVRFGDTHVEVHMDQNLGWGIG